jgi:hypothetical protein
MFDANTNIRRAVKQMTKAIQRGDLQAALGWLLLARGQLETARSLLDLSSPRRRPWRRQGRP